MPSTQHRVLVTGGTGFVGRACIRHLRARGFDVHAVSSSGRPVEGEAKWYQYDLLEPRHCLAALEEIRPTHLLHLAWIAAPGQFWASQLNLQWLASSIGLIDRFYSMGGVRAVGVGTCAEYAWVSDEYNEQTSALVPETAYGRCKLACSLAFAAAAQVHAGSAAWARLFFPYGPGEPPQRLIPSVIRALLRSEPVECTAGTQVRDFVFIDDVAQALAILIESDVPGAFNLGSGIGASLRDVIAVIVSHLGKPDLVRFGARAQLAGEPPCIVANTARLRSSTAWRPRVDLEQGIVRTIDYWRAELALKGNA